MPPRPWMFLLLACPMFASLSPRAHAQADSGGADQHPAQNGISSPPPANLSVHALCDTHANTLFDALDTANYNAASADFDTALRSRYSAEKLKQDYEALPATYGKMLGRGRPHTGDMAGHTVVMAPMIFEHGTVTAEVHCGGDGTVTDLRLLPTQVMTKP